MPAKSMKERTDRLKKDIDNLPLKKLAQAEKLLRVVWKQAVSIKEASEIFGLSVDTVRRAIKTGSLKAFQLNNMGTWKIPLDEIERFMTGKKHGIH